MAITRSYVDARLSRANRGLLEVIGAWTGEGQPNALIGDALEDALRRLGVAIATPGSVGDAELATVPEARVPYLLALTQFMLDEAMYGTLAAIVTEYDGPNRVEWSKMADNLAARIERASKQLGVTLAGAPAASGRVVSGKMAPDPQPPDAIARPWYAP